MSLRVEEIAWTRMLSSDYKQQCLVKMFVASKNV